jgi:hypothetical protein
LCEGPKDKPVLDEFFQKMGLPERSIVRVWPLGGDIMDQLDLSVFQEAHQLIALVDGDPGSSAVRKRFLKKCEELKIPVTRLERYSMENYFSLAAIASVMKGQMPPGVTELDPKKSVPEQLGFEVKKNGGKIAKEMKLEDIKGTDFEGFLQQRLPPSSPKVIPSEFAAAPTQSLLQPQHKGQGGGAPAGGAVAAGRAEGVACPDAASARRRIR